MKHDQRCIETSDTVWVHSEDICVCCGAYTPEGEQICPLCKKDWNYPISQIQERKKYRNRRMAASRSNECKGAESEKNELDRTELIKRKTRK